jgi:hypothetical protein
MTSPGPSSTFAGPRSRSLWVPGYPGLAINFWDIFVHEDSMLELDLSAKFKTFSLPPSVYHEGACAVIPTVKGSFYSKYGPHTYYALNFETLTGFEVTINPATIMKVGLGRFLSTLYREESPTQGMRCFTGKYHYGVALPAELFVVNAPHTVTPLGQGRFAIGLWAYYGFIVIDCERRRATYHVLDDGSDHVLASHQWHDDQRDELYYATFSLGDSFGRCHDPSRPVACRLWKVHQPTKATTLLWEGEHVDFLHDLVVNRPRQYCVVPEMGLYEDEAGDVVRSKALVVDLAQDKQWVIDGLRVGAHAQFDPEDPNIVYFSNHNFSFESQTLLHYALKGTYSVRFRGPGTISRYRLTSDGPQAQGEFSHPKLFRVFDHELFYHRGRKVMAVIGFPDTIFLADADELALIKIISIGEEKGPENLYRTHDCAVGTISPSPDGERLYVQTRYSFQVIDIASSTVIWRRNYFFGHSCTNHMITSSDVTWGAASCSP